MEMKHKDGSDKSKSSKNKKDLETFIKHNFEKRVCRRISKRR